MTSVYKTNNVASMILPAVTIAASSQEPVQLDSAIGDNAFMLNHEIVLELRIHTSYDNEAYDHETTVALIDSVIDKLQANVIMGSYKLIKVSTPTFNRRFDESATQGAELRVTMHIVKAYTQE
jgi:hypothetical protein